MSKCKMCGIECKDLANHVRWKHTKIQNVSCNKCGKIYKDRSSLSIHEKYCDGYGTKKDKEIKQRELNKICPLCGYEIKCGRKRHLNYCNGLGPRRIRRIKSNRTNPNYVHHFKGKTFNEIYGQKRANEIIEKQKSTLRKKVKDPIKELQRWNNISKALKNNPKAGGYRKNGGRGKKGRYKGYWCDSSWELAYVIYNLDHNIKFERNTKGFVYTWNNETHKYFPDFRLENGDYVEIKGYFTEQVKAKINQFKEKLILLDKNKIRKPYLEYAEEKYGINFIKVYEPKIN